MDRQFLAALGISLGAFVAALVAAAWMASAWGFTYSVSLKGTLLVAGLALLFLGVFSVGTGRVASDFKTMWAEGEASSEGARALARDSVRQLERFSTFFLVTLAAGVALFVASLLVP